jgi:ketosteroid isomerase-like protein
MSQETVELVRIVLEATSAGDRERVLSFADPRIVVDARRNAFNPETHVGRDGFRRMLAEIDDVWDEIRVDPQEFIDGGGRIVVIGRLVGKGKGSGVEIDQPDHQIFTVREGRIVGLAYGYTDRAEALAAAGLRE